MRKLSFALAGLCVGIAACGGDQLDVKNPNNPDVARVLATPGDVETYIGASWTQWFKATLGGTNEQVRSAMMTMSFENSSALNNFAMGPRSGFPRSFIDNSLGNGFANQNYYNYQALQASARQAANGIAKFTGTFTIGSTQRDARAKAFAWYVLGISNADLADIYDSVAVVTPFDTVNTASPPKPLVGAAAANAIAISQLDSAVAWATTWGNTAAPPSPAPNKTTLETTWINGANNGTAITAAQFIQIIKTYRARARAEVARTPAQRAAVDWASVINDANGGITSDLVIQAGGTYGIADAQHYSFSTWHQQSPMIIGFADSVRAGCTAGTTGDCFDAWLSQPRDNRYRFLIQTLDFRFPSGGTRATQQGASVAGKYFRNHVDGQDSPAGAQDLSEYDQIRFLTQYGNSGAGPYPIITKAENDLLAAEGYMRTNDFVNAAAKINLTRVANGHLPAVPSNVASATAPINLPNANDCVPRVPQPPNYTTAACGGLFEALKWEKRLETELTSFGVWFLDSRGWGDLPEGTPLEWPTPYQELQFYGKKPYNLGGLGQPGSAPKGTYGY